MSKQNVKKDQRLRVSLKINLPNLHEGKSYRDSRRDWQILIDGEIREDLLPRIEAEEFLSFRLRSMIEVRKMFGAHQVDMTFKYRVGENFAEVIYKGKNTRIETDFSLKNILDVVTHTNNEQVKVL